MKTIKLWQIAMLLLLSITAIAQQQPVPQQQSAELQPENAALTNLRSELDDTSRLLSEKTQTISELKSQLDDAKLELAMARSDSEQTAVAGFIVSKKIYETIAIGIIAVLIGVGGFYFFRFRRSNFTTQKAVEALANLEEEHQEHLRISLEREQKLRRQLQDELNRHKISKAS